MRNDYICKIILRWLFLRAHQRSLTAPSYSKIFGRCIILKAQCFRNVSHNNVPKLKLARCASVAQYHYWKKDLGRHSQSWRRAWTYAKLQLWCHCRPMQYCAFSKYTSPTYAIPLPFLFLYITIKPNETSAWLHRPHKIPMGNLTFSLSPINHQSGTLNNPVSNTKKMLLKSRPVNY